MTSSSPVVPRRGQSLLQLGVALLLYRRAEKRKLSSMEHTLRAHDAAWAAKDLDGLLALFASDATVESPLASHLPGKKIGICRGRDEIRELVRAVMERGAPWTHHEPPIICGNTAVIEFRRPTPDGEQPYSVDVMEIVDGKIQRLRAYLGWRAVASLSQASSDPAPR